MVKKRIDFFRKHPGMVVAELGVFKGDFSRQLLPYTKKLYMVDIWAGGWNCPDKDGNGIGFYYTNKELSETMNTYIDLLEEFNGKATLVRAKSVEFLRCMPDESLDAVYIDSDHSYENTLAELWLSFDKVIPGGWICGHDYYDNFPGVLQAVSEFLEETGLKIKYVTKENSPSFFICKEST